MFVSFKVQLLRMDLSPKIRTSWGRQIPVIHLREKFPRFPSYLRLRVRQLARGGPQAAVAVVQAGAVRPQPQRALLQRGHEPAGVPGQVAGADVQPAVRLPRAAQQPLERLPEVRAPTVDDGVERGVHVAQPVQEHEQVLVHHRRAEDAHHVHDEEGQPAQRERAHDDAQRLESLLLPERQDLGRPLLALGGQAGQRVVEPALALVDFPQLLLRLPVHARVNKDHDQEGNVKRNDGRGDGVSPVGDEVAALRVLVAVGVHAVPGPVHEDGEEGHQRGDGPHDAHHGFGPSFGQQALVAERRGDGHVPVYGDYAQGLDAGGDAEHVHGDPELAEEGAVHPRASHLQRGAKGHHQHPHDEVGARQRHDEHVGERLQPLRPGDGHDHQDVPEHDGEDDERHDQAQSRHPLLGRGGARRVRQLVPGSIEEVQRRGRAAVPHDGLLRWVRDQGEFIHAARGGSSTVRVLTSRALFTRLAPSLCLSLCLTLSLTLSLSHSLSLSLTPNRPGQRFGPWRHCPLRPITELSALIVLTVKLRMKIKNLQNINVSQPSFLYYYFYYN